MLNVFDFSPPLPAEGFAAGFKYNFTARFAPIVAEGFDFGEFGKGEGFRLFTSHDGAVALVFENIGAAGLTIAKQKAIGPVVTSVMSGINIITITTTITPRTVSIGRVVRRLLLGLLFGGFGGWRMFWRSTSIGWSVAAAALLVPLGGIWSFLSKALVRPLRLFAFWSFVGTARWNLKDIDMNGLYHHHRACYTYQGKA